jgi:predicted amidohydrolase YtcJ
MADAFAYDQTGTIIAVGDVEDVQAVPDRPAFVLDNLGHAVWTNSAGLELAGITADASDPQGGVFHRDRDRNLTGLLLEDAQQLVRNASALDDQANYNGLLAALAELAANGVTTVSDAGGYWAQNHPAGWERALAEGTLTVQAMNSLYLYPNMDMKEQLGEFERRFSDDPSSMLQFDTAKVYVDGILDLGTALLLGPYDVPLDDKYPSGFSYFAEGEFATYVNEMHQLGYRVSFHAIGDAAVRQALDAVQRIDASADEIAERRHRSTHTYLVDPADLDRFEAIGVVADFQQSDDAVTTDYHEYLADFIGDTASDLIPTATLLDTGANVTMSSDDVPSLGRVLTCSQVVYASLDERERLAFENSAPDSDVLEV